MDKMCNFLIQNAGPSIVYRVKQEIQNEIPADEESKLQARILEEKQIQYIFENAQADGWLGTCFHSRMRGAKPLDVCEAALRFLAEKGVPLSHPIFKGAMNAYVLRKKDDPIFDGFEKTYDRFDFSCWGLWLIRASGIARAGYEQQIDISKEIDLSLNSFLNVLNYDTLEDALSVSKSGKHYLREGLLWPCNYHLKILAFTDSWRTEENVKQLSKAVDRLLEYPSLQYPVYSKVDNYYAAPCDAFVQSPIKSFEAHSVDGQWFDKMELFARCGIIPFSKKLQAQVALLSESIDDDGVCRAHVDEKFFKNWGAYSGLQLEENWRKKINKECDITFRALLILSYAKSGIGSR